ncbi:MAG: type II toxin-antitoxin system HicA family toxin [Thermomicrobiales bacterium]
MPPFGPISRRRLRFLKQLDFTGPYAGGDHEYMERSTKKLPIPNPHSGDISRGLLARILREAGIPREQWERL